MSKKEPTALKASELKAGDIVKLLPDTGDPGLEMAVQEVNHAEKTVKFFRVYLQVEASGFNPDKAYTYVGVENFTSHYHDGHAYALLKRLE